MEKIEFKYKIDFYYQQALLYLLTLILYVGIKGNLNQEELSETLRDPIVLIIIIFVFGSFVTLFLNYHRNRKIIIHQNEIIFEHRNGSKKIALSEIQWVHIGRERFVRTAGSNQVILLKVKNRLRVYRIRIGRYEQSNELLETLRNLTSDIPSRKKRSLKEVRHNILRRKK
ncbi:MAG: hypothetical protein AAB255_01540 [Bacteroidota bacterium]